jgi:predicted TIM-barrel fold metal-dependent hydrolase
MIVGGVFERFPGLRFVVTEAGCAWVPGLLKRLDYLLDGIRKKGAIGELRFSEDMVLPLSAAEYFERNVWMGVSQPTPEDAATLARLGGDHFMWGSDYPHDEGTHPYSREHLRQLFHSWSEPDLRALLGGNAARLYNFDLAALAPLAKEFGPTPAELSTPLDELPEHPNEALLKAVAS